MMVGLGTEGSGSLNGYKGDEVFWGVVNEVGGTDHGEDMEMGLEFTCSSKWL